MNSKRENTAAGPRRSRCGSRSPVAAERDVEQAPAVEPAQAVVAGPVQVVEQRGRFRRAGVSASQQFVEAVARRVVVLSSFFIASVIVSPRPEPAVEIDRMGIDVVEQRGGRHQSQRDRESAAERLDQSPVLIRVPQWAQQGNLPSFAAGPLQRRPKRSGPSSEEVAILRHVGGQIERMLPDQPLGQFGVAALECLDDAHVIGDRARRPILLRDGHPADGADVDEQILDRLADQVRAGQLDDRLMEGDVRVRVFVQVLGRRQGVKLVEHVAQRADVGLGRVEGGEPRRHAFERGPDLDHLDDLLLGFPDDEDTASRNRAEKALLLEQRHRLADRRPADAERATQLPLVEADLLAVRIDVRVHNRLLERRVGLVAEADVGVQWLERQRAALVSGLRPSLSCRSLPDRIGVDFDWYTTYGMPVRSAKSCALLSKVVKEPSC